MARRKVIARGPKRTVILHKATCECIKCLLRRALQKPVPWFEPKDYAEHQEVLSLTLEEIAKGPVGDGHVEQAQLQSDTEEISQSEAGSVEKCQGMSPKLDIPEQMTQYDRDPPFMNVLDIKQAQDSNLHSGTEGAQAPLQHSQGGQQVAYDRPDQLEARRKEIEQAQENLLLSESKMKKKATQKANFDA